MRIGLFLGHSILSNYRNTSALGYISEYYYLKDLAPVISEELNTHGYDCDLILPPEVVFKTQEEEILYKLSMINKKDDKGDYIYDLVIELHLNYSDNPFKNGICAYYKSGNSWGYTLAQRFCKYYNDNKFLNLGVSTPPLHILKSSNPTTVVVELYYCTSNKDIMLSKRYGLEKMAEIFVMSINDGPYKESQANGQEIKIINRHGWEYDGNKKKYFCQSKQYINEVVNIFDKYYLFDSDGYLSTGFKDIRGNIYYFNPDDKGAMVINKTIMVNDKKFKFDCNGVMLTSLSTDETSYTYNTDYPDTRIDGTVVVYDDKYILPDVKSLHDLYSNCFLIRKSDYDKYAIKFSEEIKHLE